MTFIGPNNGVKRPKSANTVIIGGTKSPPFNLLDTKIVALGYNAVFISSQFCSFICLLTNVIYSVLLKLFILNSSVLV